MINVLVLEILPYETAEKVPFGELREIKRTHTGDMRLSA
jgi:hypothetical protein